VEFRKLHDVKIREFLEMCSLMKDNEQFQIFYSARGSYRPPYPTKDFLQAVIEFFEQKVDVQDDTFIREHSLEDIVLDIELENVDALCKLGVLKGVVP